MRSEFDFINSIKSWMGAGGTAAAGVSVGIGDDCAVIPRDGGADLLMTADMLIEDVDFRLSWAAPADLGHKALAVSLSDVAAMGGIPRFSMLSLGIPETVWETDFGEAFFQSYRALAEAEGVVLVGGDISKSPDRLVIDSFVCGEVRRGGAVLRSGAKPGDAVCVTGSLGGARAGIDLLEAGAIAEGADAALLRLASRNLRPAARTAVGAALQSVAGVTSLIDVSDGLAGDLRRICEASGVGVSIAVGDLPIDGDLPSAAESGLLKTAPVHGLGLPATYALLGGEDFELLFTVSTEHFAEIPARIAGVPVTRIGQVTAERSVIRLTGPGLDAPLAASGFSHF